jgi:predicted tellurium resistance membrane protein TerC
VHGVMNNFLNTEKLALPFWGAIAVIVLADIMSSRKNIEEKINQSNRLKNL